MTSAVPVCFVTRSSPSSNAYSPSRTMNPSTCCRWRCRPGPPSFRERMYVSVRSGKSASTLTVASGTSTRNSPVRDMAPQPKRWRRCPLAQAVERARQALLELDLGLPADLFTRARGVEGDALDLAGALGGVLGLEAVL